MRDTQRSLGFKCMFGLLALHSGLLEELGIRVFRKAEDKPL